MSDGDAGRFELAQVNLMRLQAPLESAQLQPFVVALRRRPGARQRARRSSPRVRVAAADARGEFALPIAEARMAMWWVEAGHRPTVQEAEQRLTHLRAHGPTPFAFGPRSPFPAPCSTAPMRLRDDDTCRP